MLLTTTQAARILHCSRQHVVNLCDQGRLPHTWVGRHRRIRRLDVDAFARPLRREDELSLWLHLQFAARLVMDPPGVTARIQQRLDRLRNHHRGRIDEYFDDWQRAIDDGTHALLMTMIDPTERGHAMRAASPVSGAGLLSPAERVEVRNAFKTWWHKQHGLAA